MALLKEITTQSGMAAKYHRVGTLYIAKDRDLFISVHSYKDSSYKQQAPLYETEYSFSFKDLENYYTNDTVLTGIYNLLKTIPIFKDAEDC